ncbi:MAG: patatin-like phospholipase family protein [Cyanobacteria bacterium SZAS LIN-3]|nr:patatin-like phospholipase family protein [Cyanobacteria bacterium SZAS LIN-3]
MNLDSPLDKATKTQENAEQHSVLGDFSDGLSSHLKAPIVGITQFVTGKTLDNSTAAKPPVQESKAHIAGTMVGDAIVFMGATAILHRVPGVGKLAPVATGAVLGVIEPLRNGEGIEDRLVHGALGAGTMAMIEHGPKFLASTGLIASAETSLMGKMAAGAAIGATTEQANKLARTGHFATLGETATGALSFGLTSGAFHGLGTVLDNRARAFAQHSRELDATSIVPAVPKLMTFLRDNVANGRANDGWHLVLGSGGSKAALTGAGVVLAARAAKLKIETIGGVSGGAVPAALAATDMASHDLLKVAKETDIATLLTQRPLFKQVVREGKKLDLLKDGIYDTQPLGEMVQGHMPKGSWPDKLWTMAVADEHAEVVFTKKGVTEYTPDGQHILSKDPPSVSDAVRATSAIPGVLASMTVFGRRLYDGALGKFGKCPADMISKHFGFPQERVIASLPVGAMTATNKRLYELAKRLSGNAEDATSQHVERAGIVVRPEVNSFHSLRFSLRPAQREEAILQGYRAALEAFARNSLIRGDALTQARQAGQSMSELEKYFAPKPSFPMPTISPLLRLTGPKPELATKS